MKHEIAKAKIEAAVKQYGSSVIDGRTGRVASIADAVTSSLNVAEIFGKRHDNVLRDYRKYESLARRELAGKKFAMAALEAKQRLKAIGVNVGDLNAFLQENFFWASYRDGKKEDRPVVLMTLKGFEFLANGFTGYAAALFRAAYVERFHEMQDQISRTAESARTAALMYPPTIDVRVTYPNGAYITLEKPNPKHQPLPDGVQAAYNEDTLLFFGATPDSNRKH